MKKPKHKTETAPPIVSSVLLDADGKPKVIPEVWKGGCVRNRELAMLTAGTLVLPQAKDVHPSEGASQSKQPQNPDHPNSSTTAQSDLRWSLELSKQAFLELVSVGIRQVRMCISFDVPIPSNNI